MKLPAEKLKVAMRKRRQEAGEVVRPAKKVRQKSQGEPAQAFEVPVEAVPVEAAPAEAASMEAAPAEEPRENAPAEMPASEDVPAMTMARVEERGQPAPAERVGEGSPTPPESVVVDSEAENGAPVPPEPVGMNNLGAEDDHPAPSKLEAEGAAAEVGEEDAPAMANEGGAGPANEREAEPTDSSSPPAQATVRHAVRKVSTQPPRPPPRFLTMKDARQAECLLLAFEVDRDEWRAWYREAESKVATELARTAVDRARPNRSGRGQTSGGLGEVGINRR